MSARKQHVHEQDARRSARLERQWQNHCAEYLPVVPPESAWRYNRVDQPEDPDQGWKLHVSATILSAGDVLAATAGELGGSGVLFKGPRSLSELQRINCGLYYGMSQIGKFLTIYPRTTDEAVELADRLHCLTRGLAGPCVPFEQPYRRESRVFYRYGAFKMMWADEAADTMPMLRMPDGQYFPDDRGVANFEPSWDPDPFHTSPPPRRRSRFGSRYLVCEPFTQRGKGGVFKALDMAETPITPCVVKEGRRHGETDWSGRDGRAYLKAEAAALAELTATGVRGPSIRDMFEEARNLYLVLDYLGERTLEDLVRESGVLPVPEALRLAAAFADLVADVHEAGWAWRDVKPRNVVVGSDGGLHAVDFEGSCRADARNVPLWGSVGYLPPQTFDPSSDQIQNDLFALGVSCYQIVVGSRAFALDVQSIKATPVGRRRNHLPPGARGVIGALLHSQPQRRIPARVASAALIASASASV